MMLKSGVTRYSVPHSVHLFFSQGFPLERLAQLSTGYIMYRHWSSWLTSPALRQQARSPALPPVAGWCSQVTNTALNLQDLRVSEPQLSAESLASFRSRWFGVTQPPYHLGLTLFSNIPCARFSDEVSALAPELADAVEKNCRALRTYRGQVEISAATSHESGFGSSSGTKISRRLPSAHATHRHDAFNAECQFRFKCWPHHLIEIHWWSNSSRLPFLNCLAIFFCKVFEGRSFVPLVSVIVSVRPIKLRFLSRVQVGLSLLTIFRYPKRNQARWSAVQLAVQHGSSILTEGRISTMAKEKRNGYIPERPRSRLPHEPEICRRRDAVRNIGKCCVNSRR